MRSRLLTVSELRDPLTLAAGLLVRGANGVDQPRIVQRHLVRLERVGLADYEARRGWRLTERGVALTANFRRTARRWKKTGDAPLGRVRIIRGGDDMTHTSIECPSCGAFTQQVTDGHCDAPQCPGRIDAAVLLVQALYDEQKELLEPFCACGHRVSACDGSQAGCINRPLPGFHANATPKEIAAGRAIGVQNRTALACDLDRNEVLARTQAELWIEDLRGTRRPDGSWEVVARRKDDLEYLGRGDSVSTALVDLLRLLFTIDEEIEL